MVSDFAQGPKKEEALEILRQLIRIRTLLPKGDEMDMVKYVLSLFEEGVLHTKIIDHGMNRASLVATLPGLAGERKIALVGHMDTFPVFEENSWQFPPFAADYVDGKVYGRGASNMKGGITAMLMTLLFFTRQGIKPPHDIVLCLTADGDNVALTGARSIADGDYLNGVTEAIFAEATDNKIAVAQRGGVWLKIKVTGKACYACVPGVGSDALKNFIELYESINSFICKDNYMHKYLGRPLCSITQLKGGAAMNILASEAEGMLDIRLLPLQDNEDVIQFAQSKVLEMMEKDRALFFEIEVVSSDVAVGMPENAPMVRNFADAVRKAGRIPEKSGVYYFTDACAIIPKLGVPFVLYGPGESIVYDRLTSEFVVLDSVVEATKTYINYITADLF